MAEILLPGGYVATVDDEDLALASAYKWNALKGEHNSTVYAVCHHGGRTVYLHHVILGERPSDLVTADHRDGNGLNNRRDNLRWATHRQQAWNQAQHKPNQSGCKGVEPNGRGFRARITVGGVRIGLGTFETAAAASAAYNEASTKYFGEFARTEATH